MATKHKPLGQLLIERLLITEQQLQSALQQQRETGELLGRILIEIGAATEDDVLAALSTQSGMPMVSLSDYEITDAVLGRVPGAVARNYTVVPVRWGDNTLTVAMSDPLNAQVLDDLRFMMNCEVRGVLAREDEILEAIERYYEDETESVGDLLKEIEDGMSSITKKLQAAEAEAEVDISSLEELAHEAPVVKLLNLVLMQAIKDRATDIHFEPFEDEFKIRYRVDGFLYEMIPPPKRLASALTSRIKVMSNLDIAETRLPQDGRCQINVAGRQVDLRISTLPTVFGESVVMRVLDRSLTSFDIEQLGMLEEDHDVFTHLIKQPNGIILATGPTGSGKTTTLYAALRELNTPDVKVITTEDPVEYNIEGITQVQIHENIGLTFARCLRSILRQDPDIILVGEIRDLDTARMAIQASLTGHLVLSTLHTNDAPGTVTRLIDMDVEPFLITSTLEAIVSQGLVRTICPSCREPYDPPAAELKMLDLSPEETEGKRFYRGRGCDACNSIGYVGQTGIFEILVMSDPLRELIVQRAATKDIRHLARKLGMKTMREDGLAKINRGITSIEEVARRVMGNE